MKTRLASLLYSVLIGLALVLSSCATTRIEIVEGEITEDWDNGKPKVRGTVQNGVRHGTWRFYNDKGELAREESYLDGAPSGTWKRYPEKEALPIYLTEVKKMMYVQLFSGDPMPSVGSVNYAHHVKEWLRISNGVGMGNFGTGGGGITIGTQAQVRLPRKRLSPVLGLGPSYFIAREGSGSRYPQFRENQVFLNGEAGVEYLGERHDDPVLRGVGITTTIIPEFSWGFFARFGIIF